MKFTKNILPTALAALMVLTVTGCDKKNESVIYIDTNSISTQSLAQVDPNGTSTPDEKSNSDIYQLAPISQQTQPTENISYEPLPQPAPTESTPTEPAPAESVPVENTEPPAEDTTPPADNTDTTNAGTWTETPVSKVMYVRYEGVFSRPEAVMNAAAVNIYYTNESVNVVAYTDTDYYKLDDGNFIHSDYLSDTEVAPYVEETETSEDTAPDDGDTTPDDGDTAPDDGDTASDDGDTAPDDGDTPPDDGDTTPEDGDTTPEDDYQDGGLILPD